MTGPAKTYAEFFGDDSRNPLGSGATKAGIIAALYMHWRTDANPLNTDALGAQLLQQFEDKPPGGVAVLVADSVGTPRVQILHGLRTYPGPLGQPSDLRNRMFAYQGDVNTRGVAVIAEITPGLLDPAPEVRVHADAEHKRLLEASPDVEALPAPAATEALTEQVKVRKSIFVPFDLMKVLVDQNLTAREAYLSCDTALQDAALKTACKPLLTFLKVGSTLTDGGNVAVAHTRVCAPFMMETGLDQYMYDRVLVRDLPFYGRDVQTSSRSDEMETLRATLQALTAREMERTVATNTTDTESSVEKVWGELTTARLLGICHKDNTDELPSVYKKLANKKRNATDLTIIQSAFDESQLALDLPGRALMTPAIANHIKLFEFHGHNGKDVAAGVLPMSFVPPGAGSEELQQRRTEDMMSQFGYRTMMGTSSQLITSADAIALNRTKGYIPREWSEAEGQLETYQLVLHCLFGAAHPLTIAYREGWEYYRSIAIELQHALKRLKGRLGPGLLVFLFQSKVRTWLKDQWHRYKKRLPPPDFTLKLRQDFMEGHNLSWLPDVHDIPGLRLLDDSVARPEALPPRRPDSPPDEGRNPNPERRSAGSRGQERVLNENIDPRLREDNTMCKNLQRWKIEKALERAGSTRPVRSDGKEMCIAFRGKGMCFGSCRRKHDHGESSQEDSDVFYQFCKRVYA